MVVREEIELNIYQPQQKINLTITLIKMRLNLTNSYKENKQLKRLKRVSVFFWNNLPNIQLFLLQFIRKHFFFFLAKFYFNDDPSIEGLENKFAT